MNTLIHADIFFVIASVGFVILAGLAVVALIYFIGILRSIKHMAQKIEGDVESISTDAKEFFHDVRSSGIYRMFFGRKKK